MNVWRQLWPFVRPYRRGLAVAALGICLFTLLGTLPPLAMRLYVDRVLQARTWDLLGPVVAAIFALPVVTAGLRYLNAVWIVRLTQRVLARIRLALYARIFDLGLAYHTRQSSGMLVNRLMADVNVLQRLISSETIHILADLITFGVAMTVAFLLSWQLSLILVGVLALYLAGYRFFSERIRRASQSYRETLDRISGRLQETVAGARHVRIYNREAWETESFLERTQQSQEEALSTSLNALSLSTTCTLISGFGSTTILALAAYLVLTGRISHGDLVAMNAYAGMALYPAVRLATMAGQMAETLVSARRVFEILDEQPLVRAAPAAPRLARGRGAVAFRDVWFAYAPDTPLYEGLSLEVPAGAAVALVGPTGCGKTTLTALLMRHWDVQRGAIQIDGADIRAVDLDSLRRLFGVVLQEPIVFEGTLADNIAYGAPRAARRRIEAAAEAAELTELMRALPQGLDTPVGTRGIKLSVGEKQRLGIARAILKDPLILVLDEATSALDSESEALIQKALARVLKGRTSFSIAHRLSTVIGADRIVVMERGRIVEAGTHAELLVLPHGRYRRFYRELQGRPAGGGA